MPWADKLQPTRMRRVAIVAARTRLHDTLVELARVGLVEVDTRPLGERSSTGLEGTVVGAATERLETARKMAAGRVSARVGARGRGIDEYERRERWDLVAGELELGRMAAQALRRRGAAVLVGWTPQARVAELSERLGVLGTAVQELPSPATAEAPTLLLGPRGGRALRPLVDTYGTVPYVDVDPAIFAGLSYILMFGVMFGDVGHGLVLAALGISLRLIRRPALASARRVWSLIVGAGLAGVGGGILYGEMFGPTGLVPVLWLRPLDQPERLLVAGVIAGSVLLGVSYGIGMANRWREGGLARLLYASSGIAGTSLYLGAGAVVTGIVAGSAAVQVAGGATVAAGLVLLFAGFLGASGGGPAGVMQALVELFDTIVRTAANALSFTRLAAFGLTHATIGSIVWTATTALWSTGGPGLPAAMFVFIAGNALAFGLEALVAGLQALRLEYYELFSRIFSREGRAFAPWCLTVIDEEEL
ncbi:MAG: V-type ATPase 116kDa subunit family protein [Candidatus Limnocylindrales bacterium]